MHYSLKQLQGLVDDKVWFSNKKITQQILSNFYALDLNQHERDTFGSPDFWFFAMGENVFGAEDIADFYQIETRSHVKVRRFRSEAVCYTIRFRNIEQMTSFTVGDVLNHIINHQLPDANHNDYIGFELDHTCMEKRVLVPFTKRSLMSADKVLSLMERIQQSKEDFIIGNEINMKIIIVRAN